MNSDLFDVYALIAVLVLLGWLLLRRLTDYLFRIEHQPRTWVHLACFAVYRTAARVVRLLRRWDDAPEWLRELPYTLLPLPLCRIGHEVWRTEKPQELAAWLAGGVE